MNGKDLMEFMEQKAPMTSAEEWDNVGLLIGHPDDEIHGIVVALDITPGVIHTAEALGADCIVTHHPVIFSPLTALSSQSLPYQCVQNGLTVFSAHTNLDKAPGGVNDTLAQWLKLTQVTVAGDGMCRIGVLQSPLSADEFASFVAEQLGTAVRTNGGKTVKTVAVCGGSGGDCIPELAPICDAFVTGEVHHHQWLQANESGLCVIEAGHYATEVPVVDTLTGWLSERFPAIPVTPYFDESPYSTVK